MSGGACTVLEISGQDRQGLLADLMDTFAQASCVVWSASIWTCKGRATLVLGVSDTKKPLSVEENWVWLQDHLQKILTSAEKPASVSKDTVVRCTCIDITLLCMLLSPPSHSTQHEGEHVGY
jgi:predicted amino acid-binding ACT domain protein